MPTLKNAKRENFCLEYVKDFNATRAARDSGYSAATCGKAGPRMLTFPDVQGRLAELKEESWRKLHMTRDELMARLARVARFDARKLYDDEGRMKAITDLDEDTAGAVASVEIDEIGADGVTIGVTKKIKASDRLKALELLGKHHGVFEADNLQKSEASEKLIELLAAAATEGGGVRGLIRR